MTKFKNEALQEPKQLIDDSGNFKELASLAEIAECWTSLYPDDYEDVVVNLFTRARDRDFEFEYPEEIGEPLGGVHIIGDEIAIDASNISTLYYGVNKAVDERLTRGIKCNESLAPLDYEELFAGLNDLQNVQFYSLGRWELCTKIVNAWAEKITPYSAPEKANEIYDLLSDTPRRSIEELEEIRKQSYFEMRKVKIALSKYIHISRNTFLHWLRLEQNKEKGSINLTRNTSFLPLDYNLFWGNPWDEQPIVWNEDIDDFEGLMIDKAYKYYNDSHLWACCENIVKKLVGIENECRTDDNVVQLDQDKEWLDANLKEVRLALQSRFLAYFNPADQRLIAKGYIEKAQPEIIPYEQLRDMFEGGQIDIESSCGKIGKIDITSIRVFKIGTENSGFIDWKVKFEELQEKYENSYTTPYIELMREAISNFNITKEKQPLKKDLIPWLESKMPNASGNIIKYMATMVRLPESQKGGYYK